LAWDKKKLDKLRNLFGNSSHKWMYNEKSITKYLIDPGFKNIRQCKFGDSCIEVFKEVKEKVFQRQFY
jgi:hypothetical protein